MVYSYSARLEGPSESDLTVASGTVFNDILLWRVTGRKEEVATSSATANSTESGVERERVCLTLSGHEVKQWCLTVDGVVSCFMCVCVAQGVIFSVRISDCGSRVVSVSDDRTVRLWDLPLDWKSMERYICKSTCLIARNA